MGWTVRREPVAPAPAAAEPEPAPEPDPAPDLEPEAEAPTPEPPRAAAPAAEPPTSSWLEDEQDQSTGEYTAAERADAEGRPVSDYVAPDEEGDDLLEETPEFLQETPEHDRLWFEQRPPRDFDFDE